MTKEEAVNVIIKESGLDTNKISDGYHTFGELYEHRIELFIAICRIVAEVTLVLPRAQEVPPVWKSLKQSNGEEFEGWFLLGMGTEKGTQITYHLPFSKWQECKFAKTVDCAPDWDGHTSADVLERLKKL